MSQRIIEGKVKDFDCDFGALFTCCFDHVIASEDSNTDAYAGMIIHCEHCNKSMILKRIKGKLMWTGYDS